jgi:hypothetical protein
MRLRDSAPKTQVETDKETSDNVNRNSVALYPKVKTGQQIARQQHKFKETDRRQPQGCRK